jgi:DNA repair photolyase
MKDKYSVIYTPGGRAKEYSELAVNPYMGCRHGCVYCYGPGTLHKTREQFVSCYGPRERITDKIEADLKAMQAAGDRRRVWIGDICDPYQGDERSVTTWEILELFAQYNHPFQILTKGGEYPIDDFHLYKPGDAFAATLTFIDPVLSRQWEPGASEPSMRVSGLREAAERGIETWVSFEPVIIPEQTLALYEETKGFVGEYRIGKLNYMAPPEPVDLRAFTLDMIERCERDGKKLYVKESLREYVPELFDKCANCESYLDNPEGCEYCNKPEPQQ